MCVLAETSTSIILKSVREHQVMLPAPARAQPNGAGSAAEASPPVQ